MLLYTSTPLLDHFSYHLLYKLDAALNPTYFIYFIFNIKQTNNNSKKKDFDHQKSVGISDPLVDPQ